jgi:hypothetical protein
MTIDEIMETPFELLHFNDIKKIEIVDIIRVTNDIYARFDKICFKYFQSDVRWLPILFMFNNISNPVNIKIGSILSIPDIYSLQQQIVKLNIEENNVPGVVKYTDNARVNAEMKKNNKNAGSTTGLPKLNITVDKITYDPKTGLILL